MANKNDKAIMLLKKQIEEKKTNLKSSEKFVPITNCTLTLDERRYNLNVLEPEVLVQLLMKLQSYKMAAEALNIDAGQATFSGFKVDDWLTDLQAKYTKVNREREQTRLKALEAKLHTLLSTDKQVELELEDIAASI